MACQSRDLNVLAYANGFTLWHYTTSDAAAVVGSAGYFNDVKDMLRVGDMILASVNTGAQPAAGILVVTALDGDGDVIVRQITTGF